MKRKRLISLLLALALVIVLLPTAMAAGLPFGDVPDSAWYYPDVQNAYDMGLINGKAADKFAPEDNMTYAEAVKLAACMHQNAMEGKVTLTNGNPWYQTYVDYAKENYIILKDYNWNAPATRAGYLDIVSRALPYSLLAEMNYVPEGSIPDVKITHPQAYEIYLMYRAGIVQGDTNFNCSPDSNIKRAEVAAILSRMTDPSKRKSFSVPEAAEPGAPDFDYAAAKAVNEFMATTTLPAGIKTGYDDAPGYDIYAVCDIDRDGENELIFTIYNAPVSGQVTVVYKLDYRTGELFIEYIGTNASIFYDNGTVRSWWSHSTGLETEDHWPFDLYVYNKSDDNYEFAGSVCAWDKSVASEAYETKFPDDADKDGNGTVYCITTEGDIVSDWMDAAEVNDWLWQYGASLGEEDITDIPWRTLYQSRG
ncbi:MAG: S-layer homology domain-containing protein [Clostridia bacterium]|nr:S-layer homology domain-containing protein [Clostridia bacterium]